MNHRISCPCISAINRYFGTIFLAFCWIAGLVCGCILSLQTEVIHFSLMREVASCSVSIVGLFAVLLPFLISAIAVYFSQVWLIFPISFLKAFSFAYVAASVSQAFGSSGWLIRLLLLFTDICTAPILFLLWLGCLNGFLNIRSAKWLFFAVICIAICGFDYFVISPFLYRLI